MRHSPLSPVHGFVLAGGRSSRMGQDKALLPFHGEPMVVIATERLRSLCQNVSISGNRSDLATYAPVVEESRSEAGPVAGLEAGLLAARQPWALFVPVDVPLMPAMLLKAWVDAVMARESAGVRLSYLTAQGEEQPAFCMLQHEAAAHVTEAVNAGERRVLRVLQQVAATMGEGSLWEAAAETFLPAGKLSDADLQLAFSNLNRPEELASAERAAEACWNRQDQVVTWEGKLVG